MKKIAAFILTVLLAISFTACGSQDGKSASQATSTAITQQTQNNSNAVTSGTTSSAAASSAPTTVDPNAKFTGKPAQKQQVNNATNDIKNTMAEIQSTINSLDAAPDVNTDNVQ